MPIIISFNDSDPLIERRRDPDERRGTLVALSDTGFALIDRLMAPHVANQTRLLAGLTDEERIELTRLLGKLVEGL